MRKHLFLQNKTFKALTVALVLSAAAQVQAQIIYVDIQDGIPAGLDFNSDGTYEFDIAGNGADIMYYNYGTTNNIHAIDAANWDTPNCVDENFVIDASNNWEGFGDASVTGWGAGNPILPINTEKFLAVKFNFLDDVNNTYYGWVRIEQNANDEIIYKDYAYNSTPGESILAGQKSISSVSIKEESKKQLNVFPNPFQESITIENSIEYNTYKLVNILGQTIQEGKVEQSSFNFTNINEGVYSLLLMDINGKTVASQKIVKK